MRVYRGDEPKDKNPAQKPGSKPPPKPQPTVRQPDSELIGLNTHRQRHGHDPLDDPQSQPEAEPEIDDQAVDGGGQTPPPDDGFYSQGGFYNDDSGGNQRGFGQGAAKLAKSQAGKRAALAASGFLAPIIIALALLLLAAEAGLQTQQVARAIVGVRFSRLYGQMNKRLTHVSDTFGIWDSASDNDIRDVYNRRRGNNRSLFHRAFGISSRQLNQSLIDKGYNFKYEERSLKTRVLGYQKITQVISPDGKAVVVDFSQGNAGRQLNSLRAEFREAGYSRFQARREVRHVAHQAGIRFSRWRQTMDAIRNPNPIRGPPSSVEINQEVSKDIISDKRNVRRGVLGRAGIKLKGFFGITEENINEAGEKWAINDSDIVGGDGKKTDNFRRNVVNKLGVDRVNAATKVARKASLALLASTIFCTAFEIVDMITQLAKLRIFQQMDTAVSVLTTASQMKAGDMEYGVSNNLNGRFDGFANSTTYQVLHDGASSQNKSRVEATIKYINHHFNIKKSFGSVFKILKWFTSAFNSFLTKGVNTIVASAIGGLIPDFLEEKVAGVINLLGGGLNSLISTGCSVLLDEKVQIGAGVGLGIIELILTFLSGGTWAAIKVGAHALLQTVLLAFVVGVAADQTDFDEALMAEAFAGTTGVVAALSDEPGQGVENYLKTDYGAWHLSEAQALAGGGHVIDRQTAVAQDKHYIAQYRQSYANEGVWSNIASAHNPFSTVAKLHSRLPSSPGGVRADNLRSAASWATNRPLAWLGGSVQADELSNYELAELLYPSQERIVEPPADDGQDICQQQGCPAVIHDPITNPENYYSITETSRPETGFGGNSSNYFATIEAVKQQVEVVGFEEDEVTGEGVFDFETNTEYVEGKLYDDNGQINNDYRDLYGKCLTVDIASFRLYQAGITDDNQAGITDDKPDGDGDEFYDRGGCNEIEARRYLIYYQDCNHISTLERINTTSSPMFANDCDHLLSGDLADELKNSDPIEPGDPIRYPQSNQGPSWQTAINPGIGFDELAIGENVSPNKPVGLWSSMTQSLTGRREVRRWRLA